MGIYFVCLPFPADHAPNVTLEFEFRLNPASPPSCINAHKDWLSALLVQVNNDVNDKICKRQLCPYRQDKMGVGSVTVEGNTNSDVSYRLLCVINSVTVEGTTNSDVS